MVYVEELRKMLEQYNFNEKSKLGFKTSVDVWFAVKDLQIRMDLTLKNITSCLTSIHDEIHDIEIAITDAVENGLQDLREELAILNSAEFDLSNFISENADIIKTAQYIVGRYTEFENTRDKDEAEFKMQLIYNHFKTTMERDFFVRNLRKILQTRYPDIYKKHWLIRNSRNKKERSSLACSEQYHLAIGAFEKDLQMIDFTITKAMSVLEYWLENRGIQSQRERQFRMELIKKDTSLITHWKQSSCESTNLNSGHSAYLQGFCTETQSYVGMHMSIQCHNDAISRYVTVICRKSR